MVLQYTVIATLALCDMPGKRRTLVWGAIVLVGWLGSSLLFSYLWFYAPSTPRTPSTSTSSIMVLSSEPKHTEVKMSHSLRSRSIDPHSVERVLPIFPPISSQALSIDTEFEPLQIFLDWPLDDKLFTRENYLSLESMLVTYPDAKFRVLLPTSRDAYTQKNGNLFSTNQFVQYRKRGYDIEVVPVGRMEQSLGPGFGKEYWSRWSEQCCHECPASCRRSDRAQPFHLMTYLRLCKLWRRGGLAADFSYLFLGPVDSDSTVKDDSKSQGFFFHSSCNDRDNKEEWQEEQEVEFEEEKAVAEKYSPDQKLMLPWKSSRCMTSSMLYFNVRESPVVECVLQQYDNSSFIKCIENDPIEFGGYEGADCLKTVFEFCFKAHNVPNHLQSFQRKSNGVEPRPAIEALADMSPHDLPNFFQSSSFPWALHPQSRVLYMGQVARDGSWRHWESDIDSTRLTLHTNVSLLRALKIRVDIEIRRAPFEDRPDCSLLCTRYTQRPHGSTIGHLSQTTTNSLQQSGSTKSQYAKHSYHTGIETSSCAPYVVVAGFVQGGAQTLSSLLTAHPQALPPLGGGTPPAERGGSRTDIDHSRSEVYDNINAYASCYRSDTTAVSTHKWKSLMRRPWCFPFIDSTPRRSSHHISESNLTSSQFERPVLENSRDVGALPNFLRRSLSKGNILNDAKSSSTNSKIEKQVGFFSVDRDVRYATDILAPYSMLADNPAMKIIFAIRNPIERMYYHFLLLSRYYPKVNFNEVIDYGLAKHGKFGKLRRMLTNNKNGTAKHDAIIRAFYTPASFFANYTAKPEKFSARKEVGSPKLLKPEVRQLDAENDHTTIMTENSETFSSQKQDNGGNPTAIQSATTVNDPVLSMNDKPASTLTVSAISALPDPAKDRITYTINTYDNLPPKRQLQTMADILFTHSLYFPAIVHYGRIMGNSNLMVVNMESRWGPLSMNFDEENYAVRLQRVSSQVYSFAGLCSHEIDSEALAEAVKLSPDLQSGATKFQSFDSNNVGQELPAHENRHKISRRALRRLVKFLRPFNIELSRIIGQNLQHWNNATSFEEVHQQFMEVDTDNETSAPPIFVSDGAESVSGESFRSENVSHEVDWFDEKGREQLRLHLLKEEALLLLDEGDEDRDSPGM